MKSHYCKCKNGYTIEDCKDDCQPYYWKQGIGALKGQGDSTVNQVEEVREEGEFVFAPTPVKLESIDKATITINWDSAISKYNVLFYAIYVNGVFVSNVTGNIQTFDFQGVVFENYIFEIETIDVNLNKSSKKSIPLSVTISKA